MREWLADVDRWLERFRNEPQPPEAFAHAIASGWRAGEREALAEAAEAHERESAALLEQFRAAEVDLVRFDCKSGSCSVCVRYCGKAYSLAEDGDLPPPPPVPICPACRHVLNMLTPFYMQRTGLSLADLIDEAEPFRD